MRRIYAVCGFTMVTLVGCGGSSNSETTTPVTEAPPVVNAPTVFSSSLVQAGASSFEQYLKNGIYSASSTPFLETVEDAAASAAPGFSTTNVQEAGVDEADRIEYDGEYLFIAAHPTWIDDALIPGNVRILQRNEDFSLTQVATHELNEDQHAISGMYLSDDNLSVLSSGSPMISLAEFSILPYEGNQSSVDVSVLNVTDPSDPTVKTNISIDGWLLSSRRIEDQLYLVTAFSPFVGDLAIGETTDTQKVANFQRISSTAISDLMPKVNIDGQEQALNDAEDCLIPEAATQQDGFNQIITITRINTENTQDMESICLSAKGNVVYVSQNNLFITGDGDNETVIHKVNLDNNLNYAASGSVPGVIGWRGQGNLRLDEQDGYLRIVSSDYQQESPVHRLSVLQQQGDDLQVVASLPNSTQTEALGKPGEDIYAVRFVEDRAYVVTFQRIDPLYVIDLENNLQPTIAGSLEIPGFSSYLHPLDGNYLLGVGQEVNAGNLPTNNNQATDPDQSTLPVEPVVSEGMKLSLFDVSNPANPVEVKSIEKEDTYTPVEFDYRALSFLKQGDQYRFAFPMEQWLESSNGGNEIAFWQPSSSLMMLDIDVANGTMDELGQMQAETTESYIFSGEDRSVIHGDHVYYIHGNSVWHGLWQSGTEVTGPY